VGEIKVGYYMSPMLWRATIDIIAGRRDDKLMKALVPKEFIVVLVGNEVVVVELLVELVVELVTAQIFCKSQFATISL